MEQKKVSVIMPAYNAEKYIRQSILSVINQSYSNWELIIVNDGSTDSTVEIINEMAAEDSRIHLHSFEKNKGACSALNQALDLATGEYLCWLSADDIYLKEMFSSSIKYLDNHKNLQGVFSKHYFIDENGNKIGEHCFDERYDKIGSEESVEPYYSMLFCGNMFCAVTMFAYTETFRKTGYFNEGHQYAGDYDYMMRLCSRAKVGYINQFNMESRVHSQQVTAQGKNGYDAIEVFYDMLFDNEVRKGLLEKARVDDCRENIMTMFRNRADEYNPYGKTYQLIKQKEEDFLLTFPQIVVAEKYTNQVIDYINNQNYVEAERMMGSISDEMMKWVDLNTWFVLCAAVFHGTGRIEDEESILIEAIDFNCNNYEAQLMLGEIYANRNNWEQAIHFFEQAYDRSTNNVEDHELIGERLRVIKEEMY